MRSAAALKRMKRERGAALLFVLVIILSLSLLLPSSVRQIALGYDSAGMEVEKQRARLILRSALRYAAASLHNAPEKPVRCFEPQQWEVESAFAHYHVEVKCVERPSHHAIEAYQLSGGIRYDNGYFLGRFRDALSVSLR